MKFQSRTNLKYVTYKDAKAGDVLATGKVIAKTENKYNAKNHDWHIKPGDGPTLVLFGAGHLEWGMSTVEMGDFVQVTYLGKEAIDNDGHKFNGQAAHNFDVAVAIDEDPIVETVDEIKEVTAKTTKKKPTKKKSTTTKAGVDLSDLD